MSTCIMYLNDEDRNVESALCDRCFVTDGRVTHEDFGTCLYERPKFFFSFMRGTDDRNAQALSVMAVGAVDAGYMFLRMLQGSVCEGGLPMWSIPEVRSNYANLGINDDYELFVNVFDIKDGRLSEHAFVLGMCSRGAYTFDVKEDIEKVHGYGIGVDGAKMIIALNAFRAAGLKSLRPHEVDTFFRSWVKSLPQTGPAHSVGTITKWSGQDCDGAMGFDFCIGTYGFSVYQKSVASIVRSPDGSHHLICDGITGCHSMVCYSVEGEVKWTDEGWNRDDWTVRR